MTLTAHHGDGLAIYPTLPADAYTLIVSDGAYGIGGFPGDPKSPKGLADWYRPHLEAWDRLAAPSSSLYFWGSPESCARMLPHVEDAGWLWRSRIVWAKEYGHSSGFRGWPMWSEEAHLYVRESAAAAEWAGDGYNHASVGEVAGASPLNTVRTFLRSEWFHRAGLTMGDAIEAWNTSASHYLSGGSQWSFPHLAAFLALCRYAERNGKHHKDPLPCFWRKGATSADDAWAILSDEWRAVLATFEARRHEYEALRYPFTQPSEFISDVWPGASTPNSGRRHPCAKRPEHIERIVKASSRPGDRVLEPFGGGAPVLRACQKFGRACDSIERNEEWHRWALAILGDHGAVSEPGALPGQVGMFG